MDAILLPWVNFWPTSGFSLFASTFRSAYDRIFFLFFVSIYSFSSRILTWSISSM